MNLIITCQRNLEDPTILEAQNMLERFGDVDAIIEKGHTIVELERSGLEKDLVNSIYKKIRMSEYKRRQAVWEEPSKSQEAEGIKRKKV